jgi:uncharacterized membrane protein YdjX (TVP38/TMEM64 family)
MDKILSFIGGSLFGGFIGVVVTSLCAMSSLDRKD